MKKLLIASVAAVAFTSTVAFAADMPVKAAPAPMFSWTGCYLGANAGGGWGRDKNTFEGTNDPAGNPNFGGALAGGQIGCDYQTGALVFGVQGMFDWADLTGHTADPSAAGVITNSRVKSIASVTSRVGWAFDRTLVYADGGIAWSETKRFFNGGFVGPIANDTNPGWTFGVGWEHAFAPGWSWKLEYNHYQFDAATANFNVPGDEVSAKQKIDTALIGLNYRYGSR
jgi:outer membrane immunogenic protein